MIKYYKNLLIDWFKETTIWWFTTLFGKIGMLFSLAALILLISAYYVFNLSFTESDNILDAHDAYYHYKLVNSWGVPPDSSLLKDELQNLKLNCAIFHMDQDTLCENDSLMFWSNFEHKVNLCDYISFSDSQDLGERHNIEFPSYVSFGDFYYFNRGLSAVMVHNGGFKYLLSIGFIEPNIDGYNLFPLILLLFLTLFILYLLVRRFLRPIGLIEKRIRDFNRGDLDSKIKIIGKDELALLSNNLNRIIKDMKSLLYQKERLLSDVSHELRTPLSKIRLLLAMISPEQVLESKELLAKLKEFGLDKEIKEENLRITKKLIRVDKHIKTIDSLITNILLSDKMSSPYSNLKLRETTVSSLVDEAVEMTFVKNIITEFLIEANTLIKIDHIKMAVAIKNLLENAYKYSNSSEKILIQVFEKENYINIAVVDGGPGVTVDEIEKIKKAFVRGKNRPGSVPGFGLGLSICNKVILAHGGQLIIKNNKEKGSTFTLVFPYKK